MPRVAIAPLSRRLLPQLRKDGRSLVNNTGLGPPEAPDVPVTKRGQIGKREKGLRHASIVRASAPCKPISAT